MDDLSVVREIQEHGTISGFFYNHDTVIIISNQQLRFLSLHKEVITHKWPLTATTKFTLSGPTISTHNETNRIIFLGEDNCIYNINENNECSVLLESNREAPPIFEREEYWISSKDGRKIPVLRYIPSDAKETGILMVFGGPRGVAGPDFFVVERLLKEGYEIIVPCYRGKSGYGVEHEQANKEEGGRGDVWDVLASADDWKHRTGTLRPLVILGFSYGGYLTLLAMAQAETPWDKGVALWPVTRIEYLGAFHKLLYPQDPIENARATVERNPIEQAHHINTPLLVLHGGRDTTATNTDVIQIKQKVVASGVSCDVIIFDDDTHALPKNRKEMFRLILNYLQNQ
ncbi:MAG: peptidase [Paenibacillus sp.]|nr:peptidase [Paenibacillus sp.]